MTRVTVYMGAHHQHRPPAPPSPTPLNRRTPLSGTLSASPLLHFQAASPPSGSGPSGPSGGFIEGVLISHRQLKSSRVDTQVYGARDRRFSRKCGRGDELSFYYTVCGTAHDRSGGSSVACQRLLLLYLLRTLTLEHACRATSRNPVNMMVHEFESLAGLWPHALPSSGSAEGAEIAESDEASVRACFGHIVMQICCILRHYSLQVCAVVWVRRGGHGDGTLGRLRFGARCMASALHNQRSIWSRLPIHRHPSTRLRTKRPKMRPTHGCCTQNICCLLLCQSLNCHPLTPPPTCRSPPPPSEVRIMRKYRTRCARQCEYSLDAPGQQQQGGAGRSIALEPGLGLV